MYYDIYLQMACRTKPTLDDLLEGIPQLREPDIQKKLIPYSLPSPDVLQRHPPSPGFLGLDVEERQAHELFGRLVAAGAHGEVLPASYRYSKFTKQQAQEMAQQELSRLCQQLYPTYRFEAVRLRQEEPRWWVFYAPSKQLQEQQLREEGELPAGIAGPWVCVDKVDGHIWQVEEMEAWEKAVK